MADMLPDVAEADAPDPVPSLPVTPTAPPARQTEGLRAQMLNVWSEEDERRALDMSSAGHTASHIARVLGRSTGAVRQRIIKLRRADAPAPAAGAVAPASPVDPAPTKTASAPSAPDADVTRAAVRALSALERDVLRHLQTLDQDDFTPADDLIIVVGVLDRRGMDLIAADLGVEPDVAKRRWNSLRGLRDITDPRGALTIDGQAALKRAAEFRAAQAG